jgi:predicted deacetylase
MSQTWNDISAQEEFVINVSKQKENGYYVELGAFHSKNGSNTYKLENQYGWKGVSFEIEEERREEFNLNRKTDKVLK